MVHNSQVTVNKGNGRFKSCFPKLIKTINTYNSPVHYYHKNKKKRKKKETYVPIKENQENLLQ